jgi:hypothetical protein
LPENLFLYSSFLGTGVTIPSTVKQIECHLGLNFDNHDSTIEENAIPLRPLATLELD